MSTDHQREAADLYHLLQPNRNFYSTNWEYQKIFVNFAKLAREYYEQKLLEESKG